METPTDHDASFVVQYMERPPRSEWESAQYYFRRYLTKRPTIFLGRLLALVLVGSMFEGLYLRFGPPAEYADAEVPEGERGVWCAHNESELGKVAITLHRAEVSLMDMEQREEALRSSS
ncbi:hypothetical protein T484DRAFT_1763947 [Baffinella frigidus]|nr:hypothetical protein T484DRAFT_1763947 [Cryptophyta sp. CCMP2293]